MRTSIGTAALVALAAGLVATACTDGGGVATVPKAGEPVTLGDIKLVSYSGCDDMLEALRGATARNVGPWGLGGDMIYTDLGSRRDAVAKSVGQTSEPAYSTTNVNEAGVDEPDLVKTDGKRIISYSRGVLRVVDVASKKVTGSLRLVPSQQRWAPGELLVHGDRALVIFGGGGILPLGATAKRAASPGPKYVLVDLKDMKSLGSIIPMGSHVDARLVGSTVRIVVRSQPEITFPPGRDGDTEKILLKRNQDVVRAAPVDAWLPSYEVTGPDGAPHKEKVKCEQVSHPEEYTGTSMLTVHTIDLEGTLDAGDPISVAADGDTVYATPSSLYVTSNPRWWFRRMIDDTPTTETTPAITSPTPTLTDPISTPVASASATSTGPAAGNTEASPSATVVAPKDPVSSAPAEKVEPSDDPAMPSLLPESPAPVDTPTVVPPSAVDTPTAVPPSPAGTPTAEPSPPERTEVHRFDITKPGAPRYVASGAVPGRLLNQYSLSDYEGNLRVATTSLGEKLDQAKASSAVYVLNADTLAKVGEVSGLGSGERIYSVRFIGPVGYVVTFRQVDPLYTLDLRDPARPKVTGELKITGYSAYLHPAGDGRLIGIGQEASEEGRTQGTQVSLFDVSDPAKPARLSRFHQKDAGSEAEWDPHAFLYWPSAGIAVVPLNSYGGRTDSPESAALVLKVGDTSITRTGLITHPKQDGGGGGGFAPDDSMIRRSLVIGGTLWTVSDQGLKASDATSLDDQGWVPFTT
ncbi:beta-propeller domain-containing protein [Sphaerisporangium corydalis]|uniref:Beta-propeller domain-containing protein n=1 Tax=Sphaerisporangium corydalis TaxID=1441875 RepID=A0ABV9ELG7_9ACTN|nr:beta-propeller domain-containing protein [Sphaerisporangium corydalis]